MKEILDDNSEEKIDLFFSIKSFLIFNKIETLLLVWLLFIRINVVHDRINIREDLLGLINLRTVFVYESGWTLFLIIGLLAINLRIARMDWRPIYWSIKLAGMISILILTEFYYFGFNLFLLFTIIYYLFSRTSTKFKVPKSQKILYAALGFIGAFILSYLHDSIDLLYFFISY